MWIYVDFFLLFFLSFSTLLIWLLATASLDQIEMNEEGLQTIPHTNLFIDECVYVYFLICIFSVPVRCSSRLQKKRRRNEWLSHSFALLNLYTLHIHIFIKMYRASCMHTSIFSPHIQCVLPHVIFIKIILYEHRPSNHQQPAPKQYM